MTKIVILLFEVYKVFRK